MINKKLLIATSVTALFLGGCFDAATGSSQREANGDTSMLKVEKAVEKKVDAPVADKSATAQKASGGVSTAACAGCHGASFEKKAMGVSKIVKDLSKDDIVKALKGYKDGTYGGGMKGIMKGQVGAFDDATIEAIASKIGKGGASEAPAEKTEEAPKAEAPAEKTEETPKAEAPAEKTADATPAVEVNTAVCAGCHGASFEKKAMGVSKIVKDLSKDDIKKALHGYKDGTYGGAMKTLMKGQVASLDDATIEAIASKFGK